MKSIIVLTSVAILSALSLAVVNDMTREPILKAKEELKRKALAELFPFEISEVKSLKDDLGAFHEISGDGGEFGVGVECMTEKGYSGRIEVLLAVSDACKVYDYKVLFHAETPGLGDKISKEKFRKQFSGQTLEGVTWEVKKDGGFVDHITAATISSRAITDAVSNGLKLFAKKYPERCSK